MHSNKGDEKVDEMILGKDEINLEYLEDADKRS